MSVMDEFARQAALKRAAALEEAAKALGCTYINADEWSIRESVHCDDIVSIYRNETCKAVFHTGVRFVDGRVEWFIERII